MDDMCDDVHMTPGVVLHKIGQLRQVDVVHTSSGSVHVIHTGQQLCIKPTGFLVRFTLFGSLCVYLTPKKTYSQKLNIAVCMRKKYLFSIPSKEETLTQLVIQRFLKSAAQNKTLKMFSFQ